MRQDYRWQKIFCTIRQLKPPELTWLHFRPRTKLLTSLVSTWWAWGDNRGSRSRFLSRTLKVPANYRQIPSSWIYIVQTGNSEPDDVTKRGSHDRRSPQDFVMHPAMVKPGLRILIISDIMWSHVLVASRSWGISTYAADGNFVKSMTLLP